MKHGIDETDILIMQWNDNLIDSHLLSCPSNMVLQMAIVTNTLSRWLVTC